MWSLELVAHHGDCFWLQSQPKGLVIDLYVPPHHQDVCIDGDFGFAPRLVEFCQAYLSFAHNPSRTIWTHNFLEKPMATNCMFTTEMTFQQIPPIGLTSICFWAYCTRLPVAMGAHCWCQVMHWPTDLEGGLGNPNVQLKGVWHQQADVGKVTGLEKVNAVQTDHRQGLLKLPSKAHRKVDVEGKGCHIVLLLVRQIRAWSVRYRESSETIGMCVVCSPTYWNIYIYIDLYCGYTYIWYDVYIYI